MLVVVVVNAEMFWLSGRGLVHVGFMLWSAEWSHGYRGRPGPAARVRVRGRTLQVCPQCGLLHIPAHQLRESWSRMQGMWTSLLSLQEEGKLSASLLLFASVVCMLEGWHLFLVVFLKAKHKLLDINCHVQQAKCSFNCDKAKFLQLRSSFVIGQVNCVFCVH